jgi:hypothetical protein
MSDQVDTISLDTLDLAANQLDERDEMGAFFRRENYTNNE